MRVTSDFFVSALVRRIFSAGGFAAIERRGATEAGAIFIRQRFRDGTETLFGPAPQALVARPGETIMPDEAGNRHFEIRLKQGDPEAIAAILAREVKFDADLWVVELESDDVSGFFAVVAE
jgi:hypothetical protein